MFSIFCVLLKALCFMKLLTFISVISTEEIYEGSHLQVVECITMSTLENVVRLNFVIKFLDGTVIEDTYLRKPLIIPLSGGKYRTRFHNKILGMCIGDIRKLTIPTSTAFRYTGHPPLMYPPRILVIQMKLVEIVIDRPPPNFQNIPGETILLSGVRLRDNPVIRRHGVVHPVKRRNHMRDFRNIPGETILLSGIRLPDNPDVRRHGVVHPVKRPNHMLVYSNDNIPARYGGFTINKGILNIARYRAERVNETDYYNNILNLRENAQKNFVYAKQTEHDFRDEVKIETAEE